MSIKEIEFLANWAINNELMMRILSSKLNCTQIQVKDLLENLILETGKADNSNNNKHSFKNARKTN